PDLILLDVLMPEMDGFATCQLLKADATLREVPVIFLTGNSDRESVVRGFTVGAVDFIAKPFHAEELLARVRTHLELRFARSRLLDLADKLGRYLSPQVYASIFSGERDVRIESYRRDLTVFFSDIADFTRTAERMSEGELTRWLNGYLDEMARIALQHGGTLDKFIGDCIMAFWGAPIADARHAQRAVACAMEMQRTLAAFKAEYATELGELADGFDIGIGIHSGPAVVGFIGAEQKLEYTAIGDTVNLASRIEGMTKGLGRILVSADTVAGCANGARFRSRGSYTVKGRQQAVELFEPEQDA
uniref:adenylate/guanylate cyclase domain-containing protein n=1 Tax=Sinimarinibacterium flocculans TaxID=985250 RepID=UPI0035137C04